MMRASIPHFDVRNYFSILAMPLANDGNRYHSPWPLFNQGSIEMLSVSAIAFIAPGTSLSFPQSFLHSLELTP